MIYNLYFECNQQAKIVSLKQGGVSSIQYFIVNSNGNDEVLTISKELTLVSSSAMQDDEKVYISEIEITKNSATFVLKRQRSTDIIYRNNLALRVCVDRDSITLFNSASDPDSYSEISVKFRFEGYEANAIVHCMPATDLYDVVLDFGSEASQMLIRHNGDGAGIVPQPLFSNILRHYWHSSDTDRRSTRIYDQEDEDKKLFRSIFFKKENAIMNTNFELEAPDIDDSFIYFVTRRSRCSGERIPNVKISYLTGQQVEGVDRTRLHVGVIMRFLHEAIQSIGEMQIGAGRNITEHTTAVRFTVLVPNVIPQSNVSFLISRLQELANNKGFLKKFKEVVSIPYIQVSSCSESDASFLERMNKVNLQSGERCLTIDIGKGTTDFSITQRINANKATSLFRSGFVGAGNAISYAIFANCIEQIFGKDEKKTVIKKVLDAEPAHLFDLDNIIEKIKHNWKENANVQLTKAPSSLTVEAILDKIRSAEYVSDSTNVISNMSKKIADNILDRLPDVRIDKIIISGRAFRFSVLETELRKKLEEKFRDVSCIYDRGSAKSGCLLGASSNIKLSLSTTMVGLPFILDASELGLTNPKEFIKDVADSVNTDTSFPTKYKSLINNQKWESIRNTAINMFSFISDIFRNEDGGYSRGRTPYATPTIMDEARELMVCGKEYPKINSNCLINISGRYYVPADQYTIDDNHRPYQIYFDGYDFYLRHKTGSHKLIAAAMLGEQSLCFESQFPYSRSIYNDDSNIPD